VAGREESKHWADLLGLDAGRPIRQVKVQAAGGYIREHVAKRVRGMPAPNAGQK
jgi:hypothetical protein